VQLIRSDRTTCVVHAVLASAVQAGAHEINSRGDLLDRAVLTQGEHSELLAKAQEMMAVQSRWGSLLLGVCTCAHARTHTRSGCLGCALR